MKAELLSTQLLAIELEKLPASGLILEFQSSPFLLKVYLVFFVLLLVSLSLLPISVWFIAIVTMILLFYFQLMFRRHLLLSHPESIQKLVLTEMGWCFIQLNNSQIIKAAILPDSVLSEHLVILNLKDVSENSVFKLSLSKQSIFFRKYHILITADSVGENKFWQLKRYLRFKNHYDSDQG